MKVVVKVGGRILKEGLDNILESVAGLYRSGYRVVFVHGGGDVVTEYCKKMGIESKFVVSPSGIRSRYTDRQELEVYVMVMAGLINKTVVARLERREVKAVGLCGADASIAEAERKKRILVVDEKGRKRIIEGGYTGRIVRVNTEIVETLLKQGYVPVVAPIAIGDGELLNVDGDQMASRLAVGISADALVFLTDVPGIIYEGKLVRKLSTKEAEALAQKIGFGMNRKVMLAAEAVEQGVSRAIIASGMVDNPVERALRGEGSVIES
uniref:Putative [LysW]-aminoadipate/[LysW]-glutamate kinase n=1 Tax=Fervidicoccus fontis TaxID=683846 RepID=A0A7J3ZL57_9CREN